ncbi:Sec-independent protein translocase protein TatB [Parapedomonas caeni]|jgi:sec-independent protein translocase protein TatB
MFDIAPSELLLVGLVALIVVGPKDLPRLMRTIGKWVSHGRGLAMQFRAGFDQMMREAELAEEREKAAATTPHVTSPAIAPETAPPLPPEGEAGTSTATPAAPGSREEALAAWNAQQGQPAASSPGETVAEEAPSETLAAETPDVAGGAGPAPEVKP